MFHVFMFKTAYLLLTKNLLFSWSRQVAPTQVRFVKDLKRDIENFYFVDIKNHFFKKSHFPTTLCVQSLGYYLQ